MFKQISFGFALATIILAETDAVTLAADQSVVLPYLADDVVGVAYVDLTKVDLTAAAEEILPLVSPEFLPAETLASERATAAAAQAAVEELVAEGGQRLFVVFRARDVFEGGPTWILEVAEPGQAEPLTQWLKPHLEKLRKDRSLGDLPIPTELAAEDRLLFGANSAAQMERLRRRRAAPPREDAAAALAGMGDADAGLLLFGDADSRRVLREMLPQAPAPFTELDGRLLADGIKWASVTLKLPPKPTVTISIDAMNPDAATTLKQAADKTLVSAKAYLLADLVSGPPTHKARAAQVIPILPLFEPKVDGTRLTLTFGDDEQEIALVHNMLPMAMKGARIKSGMMQRMNNFKQIALAMHVHHDKFNALPAAASYDADGRPLLSWRVHLLPYLNLNLQSLYKQFHLDEPWDSDHNIKLIDQMPPIYAEPDPVVRQAMGGKGLTTTVVPVGEQMLFGDREGGKIAAIKDGSYNTVLVVQAAPQQAVVWTRPDDWQVDLNNPLAGVKGTEGPGFAAGFADGHVELIPHKVEAAQFGKRLTRAAGD